MNSMAYSQINIGTITEVERLKSKTIEQAVIVCVDQNSNFKVICGHKFGYSSTAAPSINMIIQFIKQCKTFFSEAIVVHNHPQLLWHGQIVPSGDDLASTELMKWQLILLGIKLADHVIITNDKKLSLLDGGFYNYDPIKIIGFEIKRFIYCFLEQIALTVEQNPILCSIINLLIQDLDASREYYESPVLKRLFKEKPIHSEFKRELMLLKPLDPLIKKLITALITIDDGKVIQVRPDRILPYGIEFQRKILASEYVLR